MYIVRVFNWEFIVSHSEFKLYYIIMYNILRRFAQPESQQILTRNLFYRVKSSFQFLIYVDYEQTLIQTGTS